MTIRQWCSTNRRVRTVRELPIFQDLVVGRLSERSLTALIDFLAEHPDAGDLIPGAGGARKIRWAGSGRGKRGGARVITYFHCDGCPVYLIYIYLKNELSDLSQSQVGTLKKICKEIAHEDHQDE